MTARDLLMHASTTAWDSRTPVGELYKRAGFVGTDAQFNLAEVIRRFGLLRLLQRNLVCQLKTV